MIAAGTLLVLAGLALALFPLWGMLLAEEWPGSPLGRLYDSMPIWAAPACVLEGGATCLLGALIASAG